MPPNIQFTQWNVNESSPVGMRHLTIAPAFIKHLGSGSVSGLFDFGRISNSPSGEAISVWTVRVIESGQISNLRFWLNSSGMLSGLNAPFIVGYVNSGSWIKGYNPDQSQTKLISGVLPLTQNIYRQDGETFIGSGIGGSSIPYNDVDVSQFCYTKLFIGPSAKVGNFNIGASGALQMKLTIDYIDL